MFYGRFWGGTLRSNVYAVGISLFHEAYLQYSMRRVSSSSEAVRPPKTDPLYQVAEKVFLQMGADLDRHPLELSTIEPSHNASSEGSCSSATIYKNLMTGAYCLQVDPEAFDHLKQRGISQDISPDDYYGAVFSHEAVHAIENHNFLKVYLSALVALSALHVCEVMGMRLAWMCAVGPLFLFSTSCYVGQKLELRADRLAAEHNPLIRKSLISMFSAMEDNHVHTHSVARFFQLFHDHPSVASRLDAINVSLPG